MGFKKAERRLAKARAFEAACRVRLIDLGVDLNYPVIRHDLEETVLVHGPRLFEWFIEECGRMATAEQVASASHSTMSRWASARPGATFGQRRDRRPYRSIWFGYPSPFPGFDRILEEACGANASFIGMCVEQYGLTETLRRLRSGDGFGLETIHVDQEQVDRACGALQVPPATRRRWACGVAYPKQWRALDALSEHVLGLSWIEVVMRVRPISLPRRVSKEALLCLIEEAVDM